MLEFLGLEVQALSLGATSLLGSAAYAAEMVVLAATEGEQSAPNSQAGITGVGIESLEGNGQGSFASWLQVPFCAFKSASCEWRHKLITKGLNNRPFGDYL